MPLTRITSQLISIPSNYPLTGSLNGTASYATTASFAMNGGSGGGGGGTSLTGITFPYVSGSNTYTLSQSAVAANDLLLSVNGVVQTPTTDYTVSASSVTFTDSYPSGSSVNVRYLVTATSSSFVDLNNIVLTGTTTGDAYYPQVAALLHFDGTNGSTVITDNSKNNLTVTATNGAFISTAQSKFGGASAFFDGTNDYLSIPNNAEFNFTSGTFTVELWSYFSSVSGQRVLVTNYQNSVNGWAIQLYLGVINVNLSGDGFDIIGTTTILANTWYHIAVSGTAGSYKLFLNGVQEGSTYTGGTTLTSTSALIIGRIVSAAYFNGYIDELRITNGYARYTGNFTPSTTAFSNTGGDVGKALVVNSTATGVSIGTAGYFSSQLAKAWVNFNGQGTVAIRDSYNVTSITDLGTGQYLVNFSTAMNNTNYVNFINVTGNSDSPSNSFTGHSGNNSYSQTTTYAVVASRFNGALYDNSLISSIVFSN
jgi:hypothetical protein